MGMQSKLVESIRRETRYGAPACSSIYLFLFRCRIRRERKSDVWCYWDWQRHHNTSLRLRSNIQELSVLLFDTSPWYPMIFSVQARAPLYRSLTDLCLFTIHVPLPGSIQVLVHHCTLCHISQELTKQPLGPQCCLSLPEVSFCVVYLIFLQYYYHFMPPLELKSSVDSSVRSKLKYFINWKYYIYMNLSFSGLCMNINDVNNPHLGLRS
jgi:hypothetical protein